MVRRAKPFTDDFLVYADKKLLTLTPVNYAGGRTLVDTLRSASPTMDIQFFGIRKIDSEGQ